MCYNNIIKGIEKEDRVLSLNLRDGRKSRLGMERKLLKSFPNLTTFKLMSIFHVTESCIRRDIEYLNTKYPFEVSPILIRR